MSQLFASWTQLKMLPRATSHFQEGIIREVKLRPLLWDPKNLSHTSEHGVPTDVTEALWREVAQATGAPVSLVRNKWKNLRDTYRREKKRKLLKEEHRKKKPWMYFELMSFIDPYIIVKPKDGDVDKEGSNKAHTNYSDMGENSADAEIIEQDLSSDGHPTYNNEILHTDPVHDIKNNEECNESLRNDSSYEASRSNPSYKEVQKGSSFMPGYRDSSEEIRNPDCSIKKENPSCQLLDQSQVEHLTKVKADSRETTENPLSPAEGALGIHKEILNHDSLNVYPPSPHQRPESTAGIPKETQEKLKAFIGSKRKKAVVKKFVRHQGGYFDGIGNSQTSSMSLSDDDEKRNNEHHDETSTQNVPVDEMLYKDNDKTLNTDSTYNGGYLRDNNDTLNNDLSEKTLNDSPIESECTNSSSPVTENNTAPKYSRPDRRKRKRNVTNIGLQSTPLIKRLKPPIEITPSREENDREEKEDEDENVQCFSRHVASELKLIKDPYMVAIAKFKIAQVLYEAQLGVLAVGYNSPMNMSGTFNPIYNPYANI